MTLNRRTLIDTYGTPVRMQVVEGADGGKLVVEGKIGHVDKPTANNRVYPRSVMEREIARLQPRIKQGSVLGAVDHPPDGKSRVRDAGCIVRGLWVEDTGSVHGRFEVVEESDGGRNLAAFLRRGAAVGMSSRGMGSTSTDQQGWDVVGEDFRLNTWDFVADPACHDAYPGIISEDMDGEGNPTGKIVVDREQVTEAVLRKEFPHLVAQIEEHSLQIGTETAVADTEETLRTEIEAQVEEALKQASEEIREEVKVEAYQEALTTCKEDFGVRLVRTIAEMRGDVMEEVRSEIASDPQNAQAKVTLTKIQEMLDPYKPTGDAKRVLDEKQAEVDSITTVKETLWAKNAEQETQIEHLKGVGRRMALRLCVEQALAGRSDHAKLREMIGDVTDCESAEEVKARIANAFEKVAEFEEEVSEATQQAVAEADARAEAAEQKLAEAEERQERFRAKATEKIESMRAQVESELAERDQQLQRADARNQRQAGQLTEAVEQGRKAALVAYASDRLMGHPQRLAIMTEVYEGTMTSERDIDRAASRMEQRAQGPGGVNERVRRAMSGGRENLTESERVAQERARNAHLEEDEDHHRVEEADEAAADLAFLGTDFNEQEALAEDRRFNGR